MEEITFNIYTAHHSDNIRKELKGVAFAAVMEQEGRKKTVKLYSTDDTYMTIWMKGVSSIVEKIKHATDALEGTDLIININIHFWHTNIQPICAKMSSIYKDLKGFDSDMDRVLDKKLARKNRTRYDHHDDQKKILAMLLAMNQQRIVNVKFKPLPPHVPDMGTAYQEAQLVLEDGNSTQ